MAYISKLILNNNNTGEDINLIFKEGTNIIVGPKGGGKSTLLVLLYMVYKQSRNIENRRLGDTTWKILQHFGLDFLELHYSDGTIVTKDSLSNALSKNVEFVTQSDDIKTKINEAEEIEQDKQNFIKNLIVSQAEPIINVLEHYFNSFEDIYDIRARKIDWKRLEEYEKKPSNYFLSLKEVFINKVDFITNINKANVLKSIALLESYIDLNTNDQRIEKYIPTLKELLEIHYKDLENYARIQALKTAKLKAINIIDVEVKKDASSETRIKQFEQESTLFFNDMAKAIAKNAAAFYNIASTPTKIPLKDSQKSHYDLEIVIDDEIEIERNEKQIFEIFKTKLYTASRDETNWTNWIKASIKNDQAIKKTNITTSEAVIRMLQDKTDEKIRLIADGLDYNTMSLGQKTSFGLKYKIMSNNTPYLFLDQPEDNIDSYTIFSNLIPLVLDKQDNINQQSFIVTHNPNFGILSRPTTITSCDLTDELEPYKQLFDPTEEMTSNEIKKADSPLAHYLEGGKDALKDRYDILIKEKK